MYNERRGVKGITIVTGFEAGNSRISVGVLNMGFPYKIFLAERIEVSIFFNVASYIIDFEV